MTRDVAIGPATLAAIESHLDRRVLVSRRLVWAGLGLCFLGCLSLPAALVPGILVASAVFAWERSQLDEALSSGSPSDVASASAWSNILLLALGAPVLGQPMWAVATIGVALAAYGQAALRHDLRVLRDCRTELSPGTPARRIERDPRGPAPVRPRRLTRAPESVRCAICGTADETRPWVECPVCDTPHHAECWSWGHGCAVFGCSGHSHGPVPADAVPGKTD